ncbi:MAG: hypothetical protein JNJ48_08710 [Phycisphaerae bacterium]|nr:hypothetical protein [Phycisphaerae bacterium]
MHAIAAKRSTRRVQVAAAVLTVAAGALAMLPVSGAARESTGSPDVAGRPPARQRPVDPVPEIAELSSALTRVAPPAPKVEPAAVAGGEKGPEAGPEAAAPPPAPPAWRYIGSITNAAYRRAIVVVGDRQKLVAENETIDGGTTLVSITPEYLLVREGEKEREVPLAPKVTPTLQVVTGRPDSGGRGKQGDPKSEQGIPHAKMVDGKEVPLSEDEEIKAREAIRAKEEQQRQEEAMRVRDAAIQRNLEATRRGKQPDPKAQPGPATKAPAQPPATKPGAGAPPPPPNPKTPAGVMGGGPQNPAANDTTRDQP